MTMESEVFGEDFLNDPMHQTRWKAFLKKKNALKEISLEDTMSRIKILVSPLFDDASLNISKWDPKENKWK